jgi:transposase, IS30 family
MPYHHLNEEDRYVICHMRMAGFSQAAIARHLGRHRATIGREIKRNPAPWGQAYYYDTAARLARERRDRANRRYKLDDTPGSTSGGGGTPLSDYVREGLRQRWSPQQIAGRIRRDHCKNPAMRITHETVYRFVYRRGASGESLSEQLRRRHRKRRRRCARRENRGHIPGRIGIEQRPDVVDRRSRFGDWEADTMQGAKGKGALATHVERKSRFLLTRKLTDQRADTFSRATVRVFRTIPGKLRKTMTCDNGKEFARFKHIEQRLDFDVYFANPYAAWERGTNENTNGLLRDFFPKGTDFTRVSHAQVAKVQRMLNNRPRKCLNYRTPFEVLSALPGVALRN